jgi:hypothetical protein
MSTNAILRAAVLGSAALCLEACSRSRVFMLRTWVAASAAALGIFRAKNPETKKSASKPVAGAKPANRPTPSTRAAAERVEELLGQRQ